MRTTIHKTMTMATIATALVVGAGTFDSIKFNTETYSEDDPLGRAAITNLNRVVEVVQTNLDETKTLAIQGTNDAAQAQATANSAQESIQTLATSVDNLKEQVTNAVQTTEQGNVVVGTMKGEANDVGMISGENYIVFAVNRDSEELTPGTDQILMSANTIKLDTTLSNIYVGDTSLNDILTQSGQGEMNIITTVKVNGVALVPDANRAIDITIPTPTEVSLDGKLDATNGVAYGDLKVYPMPSGIVGQTHTIITHESISIGNAEYRENKISYNGETYEFSSDTNGLARLKDIPTISTNGVEIAPDASKNVNIVIPAPGEGNVIETIKTNGVAVAISNKEVDIAIPTVPDISGLATKQEVSNLTITTSKVTDLDSYKNPTISAAALSAIDGINNAPDIATIKSTLTNFLQQFVIPAP